MGAQFVSLKAVWLLRGAIVLQLRTAQHSSDIVVNSDVVVVVP